MAITRPRARPRRVDRLGVNQEGIPAHKFLKLRRPEFPVLLVRNGHDDAVRRLKVFKGHSVLFRTHVAENCHNLMLHRDAAEVAGVPV